ncbi:YjjG family noncanonical pyrimidine nucleotidase [Salinispira pacifica]
MGYAVVLFDADGTIMDFERAEESALERAFADASLDYDPGQHLPLYKQVNTQIWREFEEGRIDSATLGRERFVRYVADLALDADPVELSRLYIRYLSEGAFPIAGAEEIIRTLHGRCRMSVVTNGLSLVQNSRFDRSGLRSYFDEIVISEEVGARKPEPGIFDVAMRSYPDTPLADVLMVGDSLSSDIAGGVAYGIDTCWYNPDAAALPAEALPGGSAPTYEIRDLSELAPIVLDGVL